MDLQRTLAHFDGTALTLRDVFASAALIGLTASLEVKVPATDLATASYTVADAMLAEREKERV